MYARVASFEGRDPSLTDALIERVSALEVDHVVPLWKVALMPRELRRPYFGPDFLQLLCDRCHKIKTKAEAEAERLRQITTLERHGREAVGMPPGELSAIIQAHQRLAKHGKTIDDAAAFYLDHLERIRRCNVTVAQLVEEVLAAKRKDGLSPTYIADLKKRLARFSADFGERPIAAISVEVR